MSCPVLCGVLRGVLRGRFSLALLPLLLGACSIPLGAPASGPRAQQSLVTACRHRADEAYEITHRAEIYAPESEVNTPFSAEYQPGIPSRGLSDRFAQEQMISDCVRNTGAEGSRTPDTTETPPGTIVSPGRPRSPGTTALPLPPPAVQR